MSELDPLDEYARDGYSKDYWDLVFDQLGRRKLFKGALVVLAFLYATAIYAPLLGSDRPYVLEAIDYGEYSLAQRTLYPVTLSVGRLIRLGREEYEANLPENAELDWNGALAAEADGARNMVATMRSYLPDATAAGVTDELTVYLEHVDAAIAAARAGSADEAQELAQEAKALAKEIRVEYAAAEPAGEGATAGRQLAPITTYPLWSTISATEFFFMVLWAFVLAWPLWNRLINRVVLGADRARIRAVRRRKLAAVLALSSLFAGAWKIWVDGSMVFEAASYKQDLSAGEIVAERAVFPLIPYGFAEMNTGENYRPPSWMASSEIDEEGYYVRGPRVPKTDPVTGFKPPGAPVDERFAELPRNATWRHAMGTDSVGRDMLVRMIWGGRVSLSVGLISAVLLVLIGTTIGACAGYFGGRVDLLLSRLMEIVLCFPAFFLILMVVAFTDPNVVSPIIAIVVVIACVRWTGVARLARGEFLRLREQEFTLAARATGVPTHRIIFRHILPNAIGPILVAGAFSVAAGILTESALSFLGFGVKHPIPSWGSIVNESRSAEHWWIQLFPGLVIFVTVVCYNLVGEAIRDAVDPKMQVQ